MSNTQEIKAIPIRWGIITALLSVALFTFQYMFLLDNIAVFGILSFVFMAVPIILFGVGAMQQRKALGGFIELKEAFRAIFIMIIIVVIVTNIYGYLYMEFIDPDVADKLRAAMVSFVDSSKMSQEQADKMLSDFDTRIAQQSSIKAKFMGILIQIIVYSIFGFIIAAIVKKKRPEAMA